MTAVTFDTYEFVKNLKAKGFQEEQAEGISNALRDALAVAEVATKHDLRELETSVNTKIKELETTLKNDIKELETNVKTIETTLKRDIQELRLEFKAEIAPLKWMSSATIAGVIALIIKTFF
jgi:predicted phage-related endonuclease